MLRKLCVAAVAMLVSATLALAGDPVGHYDVVGSNPGSGTKYSGRVSVERTGDTFRIAWMIGGQTYIGTGIGSDKGLAVSYRLGRQTGVAIYAANDSGWEGVWAYADSRDVGGEAWTRR